MLPLRERGTSHPRSVVLGIARQQASAKVSICSMTGPRLVARDRWFESISLQRRVHCELAPHGFGASVIGQQLALRGEAISPSGPTY